MSLRFIVKQTPPPSLKVFSSDGYIASDPEGVFATARNSPGSVTVVQNPASGFNAITSRFFNTNYYLYRTFLYFDLSSLPLSATVTSAVVTIRGYIEANSDVVIQQGTQTGTDISGLVSGDWNGFTGSPFAQVTWITGNDPRNNFNLNAAGLSYIESVAGGTAKFCLREYDSDYSDVAPLNNDDNKNGLYFNTATPGTDNDPYITIGYTV